MLLGKTEKQVAFPMKTFYKRMQIVLQGLER